MFIYVKVSSLGSSDSVPVVIRENDFLVGLLGIARDTRLSNTLGLNYILGAATLALFILFKPKNSSSSISLPLASSSSSSCEM